MDFTLAPPPTIREAFAEFMAKLKLDDPHTWINTVADHAVVLMSGSFLARGSVFARSFKLQPGIPKAAALVAPFTLIVREPGIIHVLLDLSFYKGVQAFHALEDAHRRLNDWLARVDEESLRNAVGAAAYAELVRGGGARDLVAVVEVPPMWIADP